MGLKVLYPEPDQASQETLTVDIVAVHGLNGDPTDTWTDAKTKTFWLKDFLRHDLKGARIMTFGYNADVAFGNTTASVKDHAMDLLGCLVDEREDDAEMQRPIIFIAHSLGGIIVKEAHVEPQYSRLKESSVGIVFFGTPLRGSEKADYGKVLVKVVSGVMAKPKFRLVNALQSNSEILMDLTSKFKFQARLLQIATFYELKPVGIIGIIVEKYSALLEIDGEDQVPVNASHRDMCKFDSRDNETYKKLVKRLNRMLQAKENASNTTSALNHIQSRAQHNKYFEVPHSVSSIFTGREDICRDLKKRCLPSDPPSAQKTQRRYVLHGLGGSGKTQICLKFAQDHRESFYGIFFIDASSASRAEQGFSAMAQRCQVGKRMEDFKRWLTNLAEDWLLIIDNADDPSLDVLQYLPTGCRGTVVITTRNRDCRVHATVGSCEIGQMGREEAISLLLKASGEEEAETSLRLRALPVVETLWSLALAIIQAGAVIRQKLYTFEEYCSAYKTRRKELLSLQPVQASSDYRFTVYATWEVSKESISAIANGRSTTQVASQTATNALELLTFFGFCHFDDIWEDLFKVAWENFPDMSHRPWWQSNLLRILREDRPSDWDPFPFRQAMSLLSSYSLIQWSDHRVSLHPLVHSWIHDSLDEEVQLRQWISSLSTVAMMSYKAQSYLFYKRLMPHIQSCLGVRDLKHLLSEDSVAIEVAAITESLLNVYAICFQNRELLLLSRTAMEYTRKAIGDEHYLTWRFADYNAFAHNNLRQYQKTINNLEMRVALVFSSSSAVTEDIASAMNKLMYAYINLEHTKQASELGEKLLPICVDTLGEDHSITCNVMKHLAETYSHIGRTGEAIELCEKVIARQKTFLSDDDHSILSSKHQLATMYDDTGRFHEAIELLRHVMETGKLVLADDHINTLESQMELARAYSELGQPEISIPLSIDAIDLGEKAGVPDAELQVWRRNLARYQAHAACLLWERRTEPFQPDVVISLLVDAIELGEKNGWSDKELLGWREILQEWRSSQAITLSEPGSEVDESESKNSKAERAGGDC